MHTFFRLSPLLVVAFLTACPRDVGPGGGAPQIINFSANPTSISAPGQAVTLSWEISGSVTSLELEGVGPVAGSSTVVYPSAATTYTLVASNSSGSDTESVAVGFGTGGGDLVEDGLPPTLTTFGVSLTQTDFQNNQGSDISSPSDPRIVRVQPGGTFYAVVSATDPGGIAGVTVFLANSSPPGLHADLVQGQSVGGFTLVGEVGGCILDGTQTSVTCIYEIVVGNIPNIDELAGAGSEFAYVFRTRVIDNAGLVSDTPPRGYVIVGDGGGGTPPPGTPTPPPPGEPTSPPPGNPTPPPPSNPTTYVLRLNKAGTGEGSVTSVPSGIDCDDDCGSDTGTYNSGTSVELTVEAAQGSTFTGWSGGGCSDTDDICQVTMNQARTVTATFNTSTSTPVNYMLTVTEPENGTVTSDPAGIDCGEDCSANFAANTSVTLTADADDGYEFGSWGGACGSSTTETCTLTMDSAKSVTVAFAAEAVTPSAYMLTITKPVNGAIISDPGIDCGEDCSESYTADAQ